MSNKWCQISYERFNREELKSPSIPLYKRGKKRGKIGGFEISPNPSLRKRGSFTLLPIEGGRMEVGVKGLNITLTPPLSPQGRG